MVSLVAGVMLVGSELVGVIEAFSHYKSLGGEDIAMPQIPESMFPDVDILIATHSEEPELLYKTINGCIHMQYPDPSKVHIYLCDDMNRKEMKELAEKMGIGYFGLAENTLAKAGNLNNALGQTHSPLVATFDADMIPRSSFLLEAVPYFFLPQMKMNSDQRWRRRTSDEIDETYKIGFIQTPQSFYNADLFQYNLHAEQNIPNEQDFFFREVNVGRNKTNSPIYAGSNTLISREALESVNYIRTGTITEDFATGIDIQENGYTCYAIPTVLAHGLAPNDFKSLIKQRQRWGRGCIQTLRGTDFLFNKLPFKTKYSYMVSFLYWWTFIRRFVYILSPILYTVFGVVVVDCSLVELALIWLPSYLLYNKALKILSGNIRDQKWSNIVDTIIFPYMVLPIILETLGIKLKKFAVTPKEKVLSKNVELKYAIPHIVLAAATMIGLSSLVIDMFSQWSWGSIVLIYWLIVNLYFLIMAITFMVGRTNYRSEERLYAKVDIEIILGDNIYRGVTSDVSEKGMAVVLDIPEYIPYDEELVVKASTDSYESEMRANLVHVAKAGDHWKYSLKITDISEMEKRTYYQIVFDRYHTLPVTIRSHVVRDFVGAIMTRLQPVHRSNRLLPRIFLNKTVNSAHGEPVTVVDYNYEFILLKGTNQKKWVQLLLDNGFQIDCQLDSSKLLSESSLYRISDWKAVAQHAKMREWISEQHVTIDETLSETELSAV